jgi:superfamily II DNA or RNA helicase
MINQLKGGIQDEALSIIGNKFRCGIAISMGVGKTYIALQHMARNYTDYSRFLVVAPKVDIFQTYLEEMDKFNLSFLKENVEFSTYRSLPNQDLDYDIVYLDECHSLLASHSKWLKSYSGKILGLTGTPPRFKKSEKGILVDTYCPMVYEYMVDEAVNDHILNDYRIIIHSLSLDSDKNIKMTSKSGKTWYTSEVNSYNFWTNLTDTESGNKLHKARLMRMKALMGFNSKTIYAKQLFQSFTDKSIVFTNTKEQADLLCNKSYYSGHPDGDTNLKDFKSGKITKLSCVAKLNEGINIPGLKIGIILHAYGNEKKASQRIGRLLRLNPDDCSNIHVLCYKNTIDEEWVKSALKDFDQTKITWL